MKNLFKTLFIATALIISIRAEAQIINPGQGAPAGAIVYSLPMTAINLKIGAEYELFTAGPYARFAQKYLGVQAREENRETYRITSVQMIPYIEADPSVNIALNLGNNKNASANFLEMINQGLIMWSDSYAGKMEKIQYPLLAGNADFLRSMSGSNLTSEMTTLYRTVQSRSSLDRTAVQQSQVVEKSLEKRAEETANLIFKLRAKRLEIITGETDATFSGEALRAAITEINRLEREYLDLFLGKTDFGKQTMSFDVVPKADNEKQIYIAFRLSDTQGLLPASNLSGRPIVMELIREDAATAVNMDATAGRGRVIYRKPAIVNARLTDGQTVLIQSRIPVYQLGNLMSFPIEIATGRL
ncbi:MAG: DUF4831 family protein [Bacteroidales bacterium]|nr:DUF4831 family protein [Bacteroidales bacterium]MDP3398227.1 DUF4831 family protein [Bacteroidales bacterium]